MSEKKTILLVIYTKSNTEDTVNIAQYEQFPFNHGDVIRFKLLNTPEHIVSANKIQEWINTTAKNLSDNGFLPQVDGQIYLLSPDGIPDVIERLISVKQ